MGRECWKVTGTLCKCSSREDGKRSLAEKIVICRNECAYYQSYVKKIYYRWQPIIRSLKIHVVGLPTYIAA